MTCPYCGGPVGPDLRARAGGEISDAAVEAAANKLSKIGLHYHWFAQSRADLAASDPIGLSEFDGAAQEVLNAALPFLAPQPQRVVTDEMVRAANAMAERQQLAREAQLYLGKAPPFDAKAATRQCLEAALSAAPPAPTPDDQGERVKRLVEAAAAAASQPAIWLIWSGEHKAYWRPDAQGYTANIAEAGRYKAAEVDAWMVHAGAEKRLESRPAPSVPPPDTRTAVIVAARAAAGVQRGTSDGVAWLALANHFEGERG